MNKTSFVIKRVPGSNLNKGYIHDPLHIVNVRTGLHNVVGNGDAEHIFIDYPGIDADLVWVVGWHTGLDYLTAACYDPRDLTFVGVGMLNYVSLYAEYDDLNTREMINLVLEHRPIDAAGAPMNARTKYDF